LLRTARAARLANLFIFFLKALGIFFFFFVTLLLTFFFLDIRFLRLLRRPLLRRPLLRRPLLRRDLPFFLPERLPLFLFLERERFFLELVFLVGLMPTCASTFCMRFSLVFAAFLTL